MICTRKAVHRNYLKCAVLGAALSIYANVVSAENQITLRSVSGELELSGPLIGFDGEYIQIASDYGPVSLIYQNVVCSGEMCPVPDRPTFSISGAANANDLLLPALWEGFARSKGWRVTFDLVEDGQVARAIDANDIETAQLKILSSTTQEGFADLFAHQANAVIATREINSAELRIAQSLEINDLEESDPSRIIALDALTPIVSPLRTVEAISLVQLQRALRGEVFDWESFGEPSAPIKVHLGPMRVGTTQYALDVLLDGAVGPDVTFHNRTEDLMEAVASDRNAIGLSSFQRTGSTRPVGLRDDCGFLSKPTPLSIKTEDYPLTAPVFLYVPDRLMPKVFEDFFDWTRSSAAQLIVRRSGFVDQTTVPIPLDAQGQRFANAIERAGIEVSFDELQRFVRRINGQTRLSVSFRFEAGSSRLDAQSRSNLIDLVYDLDRGVYDGKTLTLFGFSDGVGDAKANRDLSAERAESVRQALANQFAGDMPRNVDVSIAAFGEALPMACDDTEIGQRINRRVELWVSD